MTSFNGAGYYRVKTETGAQLLWCDVVRTPSGKGAQLVAGWRSEQANRDLTAPTLQLLLPRHQFDAICLSAIYPLAAG